jgi:cytochrome bd ubiquinol oxidase subunit II
LAVAMLGFIVVVSIWTPLLNPVFAEPWFGWPGIVLTSPVRILVALVGWLFWRGLSRRDHLTPMLCAQAWFALCYAGLGISLWPMIVPPVRGSGQAGISIWDAAAPATSQAFLLVGAVVLIPIILGYTGYAYWVFRGKVRPGMHYH